MLHVIAPGLEAHEEAINMYRTMWFCLLRHDNKSRVPYTLVVHL